jgi:hypothetical protein
MESDLSREDSEEAEETPGDKPREYQKWRIDGSIPAPGLKGRGVICELRACGLYGPLSGQFLCGLAQRPMRFILHTGVQRIFYRVST